MFWLWASACRARCPAPEPRRCLRDRPCVSDFRSETSRCRLPRRIRQAWTGRIASACRGRHHASPRPTSRPISHTRGMDRHLLVSAATLVDILVFLGDLLVRPRFYRAIPDVRVSFCVEQYVVGHVPVRFPGVVLWVALLAGNHVPISARAEYLVKDNPKVKSHPLVEMKVKRSVICQQVVDENQPLPKRLDERRTDQMVVVTRGSVVWTQRRLRLRKVDRCRPV